MYYYHPRTGRFEQSARNYTRSSYTPRRAYDDEVLYVPFRTTSQLHHKYDTTGNDYYTRSQVNRELLMSSAAMEDNYDISARSRQRDRDVMSAANRAIAATELHTSPRSAVAVRRAMRGHSTPPGPFYVPTSANISMSEVHVALARANHFNKLRASVPPASVPYQEYYQEPIQEHIQEPRYPRVTVRPWVKRRTPIRAPIRYSLYYQPSYVRNLSPYIDSEIEGLRHAPRSILRYLRNLEMKGFSKRPKFVSTYVPCRKASRKAALLGNKVDVTLPKRRRPRSAYAQAKVRQMNIESSSRDASPVGATAAVAVETAGLKAHKPVWLPPPRHIWDRELNYSTYRYTA